jgi:hypothetical protein
MFYVNNIKRDANIYSFFIAAKPLYMFRVSKPPIIRSALTVTTASGTGHMAVVTVTTLLMMGGSDTRNMYSSSAAMRKRYIVASRWILLT